MAAYIVSYDLHVSGQNYECIVKKLESYGTHWHMQRSVWIIITSQSAIQIRDFLSPCLDSNDKLFVGKLSGEAAWTGYRAQITEWLKKHL
jgi:CRISPR/Cas system-associated endoribonuclease Cas2